MLSHHVFFDTLGQLKDDDPNRDLTLAGLLVLRQVDLALDRSAQVSAELSGITGARDAVSRLSDGNPSRAILTRILDAIDQRNVTAEAIGQDLLAFGRALNLEAKWPLSVDVFQTVARRFDYAANASLVIEALTALGSAARHTGDWDMSAHAYAEAQHLADTRGDRAASLTVQVGIADTYMARGNLPAAQYELEEVLHESATEELQGVQALALHARASVAHSRGDYREAIHFAYRSLELTTNASARDRILADIAAAYAGLGMRDTARDAYSIVVLTSPHQWVRWQAMLNLMELVITEGNEELFDKYAHETESAALDPKLQAYSLFFRGLGMRKFGREGAEEQLRKAQDFAARHELHQIAFEIDQAMVPVPAAQTPTGDSAGLPVFTGDPGEVQRIAEALSHLREQSTAA